MMKLQTLFLAVLALAVASCSGGKKSNKTQKEITFGYVDGWTEGVAMTEISKVIFENHGYDAEIQKAAVDLIFASLANGDTDVFMDTWMPSTHAQKVGKFEGKIESIGINYDNAKIGLVVPNYVNINSIEEINANREKFNNKIIGIEKGSGLAAKTDLAVKEYGLQLEHLTSSSIAMVTELQKSIAKKEWVLVAGWAPHWKFDRFDIKFLDDPKGVFGKSETIETYARKGFKEMDAFAANYFNNFYLNEQQMAELLNFLQGFDNTSEGAKQWVNKHKGLVDSWLKEPTT